jgi:hypothetical protein
MKIREFNVTDSDKKSAEVFFAALMAFYDVGGGEALDMFARDGALTVSQYAYKVKHLDVWELMGVHEPALANFRPRDLKIGCSYQTMRECNRQYDMIVIDTPQGLHHDFNHDVRVEHFGVLDEIGPMLKDRALVVLYVNKRPYNKDEVGDHGYDQYDEYDFKRWMLARKSFYQYDPQNLTEERAMMAYRNAFSRIGFNVQSQLVVPCYSDVAELEPYAFRLALEVVRR